MDVCKYNDRNKLENPMQDSHIASQRVAETFMLQII